MFQRVMRLPRGTSMGWSKGLTGTSSSSTRRSAKSCNRGGAAPCTGTCWWPHSWKAALQRRMWGSLWAPSWTWANNVPLLRRRDLQRSLPASAILWNPVGDGKARKRKLLGRNFLFCWILCSTTAAYKHQHLLLFLKSILKVKYFYIVQTLENFYSEFSVT